MNRSHALLLAAILLPLSACGGGDREPSAPPGGATASAGSEGRDDAQGSPTARTEPDAGTPAEAPPFGKATVRGTVTLVGDAPRRRRIDIGADQFCNSAHPDGLFSDSILVGEGGTLANVFVQIRKGLPRRSYDPPAEPVELDQVGCTYVPHVLGMLVGQKLIAVNSDPIMHNVHAYWESTHRDVFNFAQSSKGVRNEATLRRPGLIHVKCEVHSWMGAWVHVLHHPFFAVTGDDGTFSIGRVPPGTYEIEAWHEKLGTLTRTVEVGEDGVVELSFEFGEGDG